MHVSYILFFHAVLTSVKNTCFFLRWLILVAWFKYYNQFFFVIRFCIMEPISELCAVNGFEIFLVRLVIMKIAATFKGNRFNLIIRIFMSNRAYWWYSYWNSIMISYIVLNKDTIHRISNYFNLILWFLQHPINLVDDIYFKSLKW